MSSQSVINGEECAYPVLEAEIGIDFHPGLTKREHFAGLAMRGLLSSDLGMPTMHSEIIERSVQLADTLLAELDK
tara:strand:- start:112 stop:336 length:225 start_codon:yes stop_codon:yes gene_type:complete